MWMLWIRSRLRWVIRLSYRQSRGEKRLTLNNRNKGKLYEQQAASFLKEKGFCLLVQNFRCRQGEVDLIGIHQECLVFVEVKYRKSIRSGMPEEAVGVSKQVRICRVSDYYRFIHPKQGMRQLRYDVVAIDDGEIRWHQNAFPYHPV